MDWFSLQAQIISALPNHGNRNNMTIITNELVKSFNNETDFIICVFQFKVSKKCYVTIYDMVNRTHVKDSTFANRADAIKRAKELNKQYSL